MLPTTKCELMLSFLLRTHLLIMSIWSFCTEAEAAPRQWIGNQIEFFSSTGDNRCLHSLHNMQTQTHQLPWRHHWIANYCLREWKVEDQEEIFALSQSSGSLDLSPSCRHCRTITKTFFLSLQTGYSNHSLLCFLSSPLAQTNEEITNPFCKDSSSKWTRSRSPILLLSPSFTWTIVANQMDFIRLPLQSNSHSVSLNSWTTRGKEEYSSSSSLCPFSFLTWIIWWIDDELWINQLCPAYLCWQSKRTGSSEPERSMNGQREESEEMDIIIMNEFLIIIAHALLKQIPSKMMMMNRCLRL